MELCSSVGSCGLQEVEEVEEVEEEEEREACGDEGCRENKEE